MNRLKRLVHEIHRRSLWQVLAIFLAASWGVIQFVDFLTERAGLPEWTPSMALVLLLIGLPVVLATAYVQEGGAGDGMPDLDSSVSGRPPTDDASEPASLTRPGDTPAGDSSVAGRPTGALSPVSGADVHLPPAPEPTVIQRWLTWRKAMLGGVGAFALLGISVTAYFVMWSSGIGPVGNLVAQGVFEEGELIVLADFDDPTGTGMGNVVTEALRVDLQESSIIQLAAPTYVTAGMARMGLAPNALFTPTTARELALRDGLKAVIQGEVAPVGSGYLLTASVVATETGQVLRAFRVPVASDDELLGGIDRLSREIREKSGESLRSIRQGVGLAQATTGSLDALRLYTEAIRTFDEGRQLEALPLLEEALELDPEFAMAWRKLAVILSNAGLDPERMRHASRRAWELRRRLTDREGGLAEAWYLSTVEDSPEGAADAYRRLLDRYPDDPTALNNLAVRLLDLGRWEDSEDPLRRLVSRPSPSVSSISNFIQVLWTVEKQDEARSWQDSLEVRYPEALTSRRTRGWLLAGEGRWGEAHQVIEGVWRDAPTGGGLHVQTQTELAGFDLARGRHAEAMGHLAAARRDAIEARIWETYWWAPAFLEFQAALALRGAEAGRDALGRFEREVPFDSLGARSLRRPQVASYHALAGNSEGAGQRLSTWESAFAPEERGRVFRFQRELFRALDAWGRGDWDTSVAAFHRVYRELQPCGARCPFTAQWGIALEEAGRTDEALEKYRWHLADAQLTLHAFQGQWTPAVLERMALIQASRDEIAEARASNERIIEQFGEGDGPFLEFVERARERLAAL
jgi:tetratricopeptide (TPR) repeat protein